MNLVSETLCGWRNEGCTKPTVYFLFAPEWPRQKLNLLGINEETSSIDGLSK